MRFDSESQRRAVMARLHDSMKRPPRPVPLHRAVRQQGHAKMVLGDFRQELPKLHGVRAFFTDPPYNFRRTYKGLKDSLPEQDYTQMLADMARLTYQAADKNASLFVVHYPQAIANVWPLLTREWKFRNWITWCYAARSGASKTQWTPSSRTILWLTKGDPPFDGHATVRPYLSKPKSTGAATAEQKLRRGAPLFDWWVIPQINPHSAEHSGYAYQIPSEVIRRCVLATTRKGDLVADPFLGSGSTVKVATSLGRNGWGCDINPKAAAHWKTPAPAKPDAPAKPMLVEVAA